MTNSSEASHSKYCAIHYRISIVPNVGNFLFKLFINKICYTLSTLDKIPLHVLNFILFNQTPCSRNESHHHVPGTATYNMLQCVSISIPLAVTDEYTRVLMCQPASHPPTTLSFYYMIRPGRQVIAATISTSSRGGIMDTVSGSH